LELALAEAETASANGAKTSAADAETAPAQLHKQTGRLQMELECVDIVL
jgi:hypothetical protein